MILNKYQELFKKLNFSVCLVLTFWIPLLIVKSHISYGILLWLILWILEGDFKNKFQKKHTFETKLLFFLLISFYLLHIVGLIYTQNLKQGFSEIEKKVTIFLFPILLFASNELYRKKFNYILISFISGNLLASLICLGIAFYKYFFLNINQTVYDTLSTKYGVFIYTQLSYFLHPSYFSMYLILCIVMLFYFISKNPNLKIKILLFILLFIFVGMVALLSSRANYFSLIITVIFSGFIYKILKKTYAKFIFVSGIILIISFFLINGPRNIDKSVIKQKMFSNIRGIIWEDSFEIIKENFLFGIGTGDAADELDKKLEEGNVQPWYRGLNAHNQYIETFIELGFLGISVLVSIFGIAIINSIKQKNYLLLLFLINLGINMLFEAMFITSAGVLFFAFFVGFFAFNKPVEENSNINLI